MPLKKATDVVDSIKMKIESEIHSQVDELMEDIERALDNSSNSLIQVEVPSETRKGVITKVFDTLRDLGYKLCLVETVNREGEVQQLSIRVSLTHLIE